MSETEVTTAPRPLLLADGRPAERAWSLDPALKHLNHGSFGAVPLVAQERQALLRAEMERSPVVWFPALPPRIAAARVELAAFLRVDAGDLALVPNASAGASVVFAALTLRPGAEIVVTDHGYGAVTMGAERLARRWGARVRTARVPLDAGEDEAYDAVTAEFGDATQLVVVDQITSATARRLPVERIGAEAARRGIATLVDGAHAPGLLEAPLAGATYDAWTGNLHKWGCAPRGTAALVARGPLRELLYPLIDSWAAADPFPDRFDQQGTVDATAYLAAPASLDFVERTWGWSTARRYMDALADYGARVVGGSIAALGGSGTAVDVGMPVPGMRLVRLPDGLAADRLEADGLRDRVARELGVEAAFTSFGGVGYLRLSAHVYNTPADYEYFAEECVPVLGAWAREDTGRPGSAGNTRNAGNTGNAGTTGNTGKRSAR
ncbi:selenocysteine lyase / isopenicillin N epimerase [Streptomyces zinciresistens K42]|uniref:Selenocysteine lyase / isopenicillin N epimerase n=1 Tax=Streptomyces zinciresistens K42 TaxID=700597 RepID=G2GLR3_9ACTN|nr:aminotransferase class V-fold PLP-dependent enzyme [Streptomyces zinciresistens]EGX55551.1 selenocysteine lyase / isopenicillin N epimerase [Streptomyces zinciresistens K42]